MSTGDDDVASLPSKGGFLAGKPDACVVACDEAPARSRTHPVRVGTVTVGGGAPVSVQSMCTTDTADAQATLAQIDSLVEAGCEIVRVAIPSAAALNGFADICQASPLPVVADIHFDHRLAIFASQCGAAALRINPGNIGSWDQVDSVIDAAGVADIPIRIGVNAGSLDSSVAERASWSLPDKLVASSVSFCEHFMNRGFTEIVLSAKAHSVLTTLETYRRLSAELPHVPLHLGVTEAGTLRQGTVKNAAAVGILLEEGIGDTMRLSLTAHPAEEVRVAWDLLAALGMRRRSPELVSCPTCGRCQVDLMAIAEDVAARLETIDAPLTVAVMGCVVNGPGEAADADVGIACGRGAGMLFADGKTLRKVPEHAIVDELMAEVARRVSR